ncbi:hypothetical protein BK026_12010 [Alteromonas sp. V450]|uniref:WcbI family polysaccharide biosynthesis putative acetyltransferase n=1 Tax=Alteromonas sp. V450 TaxID=1912139 RepID=UPI0008FF5616|nr:WcbI family polysaccharide biosynthesis putative acetyltransferase [Alteromonas sp. V450]OJF69452.1 hypothetical protein BK026_12010 [Alteromonas sp. V450]
MKKITIFANCQGEALYKYFEEIGIADEFFLIKVAPIQTLRGKDIERVEAAVSEADIVFAQYISDSYFIKRFSSSLLLQKVQEKSKIITFPNFYFDGFFPHLGMLRGVRSALHLVHDYNIVAGYLAGMSVYEIIELTQSNEFYTKEMSERFFDSSLSELKRREVEYSLLNGSKIIENHFKEKRLFNQFNHPTRQFFSMFFDCVKNVLPEFSDFSLPSLGTDYLDHIKCPLYPSTHQNLQLKFENPIKFNANGRSLSAEEITERFYFDYQKTDKSLLEEAMSSKQWVSENIKRLGY